MFRKHFPGQKLPRRKLKKHDGQLGILLASDAKPFIPDGCSQIYERRKRELAKSEQVCADETCVRENQLEDTWQAATENLQVKTSHSKLGKDTEDGGPTVVRCTATDAGGVFGIWGKDEVMGCGISSSSQSEGEGEAASGSAAGSGNTKSATPRPETLCKTKLCKNIYF